MRNSLSYGTLPEGMIDFSLLPSQQQRKKQKGDNMKELRRKDRAISEEEALELLTRAEYGILSTVSEDGKPYGVPLNYCVVDNCIYFHCAVEGQKIDNINHNKSVSFCAVENTEILPDQFATKYESVIASGEIGEVFGAEKRKGLEGLLNKYSKDYFDEGAKCIDTKDQVTKVFKITISQLCGKARKE